MNCERLFLGREEPYLHRVVRLLWDQYARAGFWDLSGLVVAVPGGRAGRRLAELLTEAAARNGEGHTALLLPRIVTTGDLPEELYSCQEPVADGLTALLALAAALRGLGRERLAPLVPRPPESDSLLDWVSLAREVERLRTDLASEGLRVTDAARRCAALPGFHDGARWEVLSAVEEAYRDLLAGQGWIDRHEARFWALEQESLEPSGPVLLVATVDLPQITRQILSRSGATVTALIPASPEEADGFDELGCLVADYWIDRHVMIPDSALRIVDRPVDQSLALLDALAELEGTRTPDEITVGVGDEKLAPALERALRLSGVPVRSIFGRPLTSTRPALLLGALRDYLASRRTEDFAALLRHPDLEAYLYRRAKEDDSRIDLWRAPDRFDAYVSEHLPLHLDPAREDLPGEIATLCRWIGELAAELLSEPCPLSEWSARLLQVLRDVYAPLLLDPGDATDRQLLRALRALVEQLENQSRLPAEGPLAARVSFSEAISFTLGQLSGAVLPQESDQPAVELLGWLELALDDAPVLIVTGVNEGAIPASVQVDPFLPDSLRRSLGLVDNRHRYARDLLLMTVILQTRPQVTLIAGRRDADGDPLTPSRLLFACDEETLVHRTRAFLGVGETGEPARALLPAVKKSRFWAPRPKPAPEPLGELAVTAFAAYLSCPYRFYLSRILKLRDAADEAEEMDALLFGSLVHDTLRALATGTARDSTDPSEIAAFLEADLERRICEQFGGEPAPAIRLQQGQALRRLQEFAYWQARHAREGWRIRADLAECELTAPLDVDGETFLLKGRIDRVDEHPDGSFLLLDYKTGDTARTPEETHGVRGDGEGEWTDLQLPLYRLLAASMGVAGNRVSLGYINLSKETEKDTLALASWDEACLSGAIETAREVIRRIRRQEFWPPGAASSYGDAFSGICFDNCPNRAELLQNEPPVNAERRDG
ncbi:MAG TPA: PD-(D/E)XK nuclease family protein [Armatimonadota bacterium]|nr:PD-(D/E)XK nuclease family protein [Armatimonadota bacterium]